MSCLRHGGPITASSGRARSRQPGYSRASRCGRLLGLVLTFNQNCNWNPIICQRDAPTDLLAVEASLLTPSKFPSTYSQFQVGFHIVALTSSCSRPHFVWFGVVFTPIPHAPNMLLFLRAKTPLPFQTYLEHRARTCKGKKEKSAQLQNSYLVACDGEGMGRVLTG